MSDAGETTEAVQAATRDCPFCGELILQKAIKCKHCGSMLDSSSDPVQTATAPPTGLEQQISLQDQFTLVHGEQVLAEGLSTYIKSAINCISCNGFATNYRIVFCSKGMTGATALFGVLGGAAALARKSTKITVQVPISDISSVVKGKHGLATKYSVVTKSGQTLNLQFPEKFEAALMSIGVSVSR